MDLTILADIAEVSSSRSLMLDTLLQVCSCIEVEGAISDCDVQHGYDFNSLPAGTCLLKFGQALLIRQFGQPQAYNINRSKMAQQLRVFQVVH